MSSDSVGDEEGGKNDGTWEQPSEGAEATAEPGRMCTEVFS